MSFRKAFAVAGLAAGILRALTVPAETHDIYSNLYNDGSHAATATNVWCCRGDEKDGDCEGVGSDYKVRDDGSADFLTRRYGGKWVHVARDKVTWLPVEGGEHYEAHWCGKPRAGLNNPPPVGEMDQIDPEFWTFCAFIAPGGV